LLAFLWIAFLLAFLSFSTTQEYYSMPCYPAFAMLIGAVLAGGSRRWVSFGYGLLLILGGAMAAMAGVILYLIHGVPAVGDISSALTHNPDAYTLSLGHLQDLTLQSFAYLRGPLAMAGIALGLGSLLAWRARGRWVAPFYLAAMMRVLVHALTGPWRCSIPISPRVLWPRRLRLARKGHLIIEGHYYPASSVAFYTNQPALLLNGRVDNMVYGAAAPGLHLSLVRTPIWRDFGREVEGFIWWRRLNRVLVWRVVGTVYVFSERGGKCAFSNLPK
jgi:hypothetical protein